MPDQPEPQPEPNFEQALSQLERIVTSLERGESELTAALANYGKAALLLTQCHRLLDQAEQSVALLTGVDPAGNPITATFDATASITRDAGPIGSVPAEASANRPRKRPSPDPSRAAKTPPASSDGPFPASDPPF